MPEEIKDERTPEQIAADKEATTYINQEGVEVVNGLVQETPPTPEPTKEVTPEPEPVTQPTTPPPPPIDPKALAQEVAARTAEELAAKLQPKQETKPEEPVTPWTKEGRNPKDYDEIVAAAKEQAKQETLAELQRLQQQQYEAYQQRQQQASQAQQAQLDSLSQSWDADLARLESKGLVPRVTNPADENDPGRLARIDLFTQMKAEADKYITQNQNPPEDVLKLSDFYQFHYQPTKTVTQEIPGATAPISIGRGSAAPNKSDWPSYEEIHSLGVKDLAKLAAEKAGGV